MSGSALRMEGQLTCYLYKNGPCYRCLYKDPPPPETVTNCSDGGVLSVIPGIIGVLQALEVVKMITGKGEVLREKMLMFDGMAMSFRLFRLRKRNPDCLVCGDHPKITQLIDYEEFCGAPSHDKVSELFFILKSNVCNKTDLDVYRQKKESGLTRKAQSLSKSTAKSLNLDSPICSWMSEMSSNTTSSI